MKCVHDEIQQEHFFLYIQCFDLIRRFNVHILAAGDLYQLPPVRQSCIFKSTWDQMARLQRS